MDVNFFSSLCALSNNSNIDIPTDSFTLTIHPNPAPYPTFGALNDIMNRPPKKTPKNKQQQQQKKTQQQKNNRGRVNTNTCARTETQACMRVHSGIYMKDIVSPLDFVSWCGLTVRRLAVKQKDLGSIRFGSPFSSLQKVWFMDTVL